MHVAFIIFHVQSGSVQRCIFHAFLFFYIFSVHRHPHPRSLIFKYGPISALYCVFNVYTVQESCLFTKLFNSVFSIFSSRNEMLFSNIRVVVGKKKHFSVFILLFYFIICCYLQDVTFCLQHHHHHKKVTISP